MIDPKCDGVDHINIYSKGTTELGRFLSNFAHTPIKTKDGEFASIEGYWYWLGTNHPNKNVLRTKYGFSAKKIGRELGSLDWQDSNDFKANIENAIFIKLKTYPEMFDKLINLELPLKHYYVFGGKVVEPKEGKWMLDFFTSFIGSSLWK